MKKLNLKITVFLFALIGLVSSCSTEELSSNDTNVKTNLITKPASGQISRNGETYKVKHYAFVRPGGANGLGHVGVGFEVRTFVGSTQTDTNFYIGGVENPNGSPFINRGDYNGGWRLTVKTSKKMFEMMRSYGYNYYKTTYAVRPLTDAQYDDAYYTTVDFPNRGYILAGNNCLNATYDVLYYSNCNPVWGSLPTPGDFVSPNLWFGALSPNYWTSQKRV